MKGSTADPLALPIFLAEQTHLPEARLAPIRSVSRLIPPASFPVAAKPRTQGRAVVEHVHGVSRFQFSGVPQIPLIAVYQRGRPGDQDLISDLANTQVGRFKLPA